MRIKWVSQYQPAVAVSEVCVSQRRVHRVFVWQNFETLIQWLSSIQLYIYSWWVTNVMNNFISHVWWVTRYVKQCIHSVQLKLFRLQVVVTLSVSLVVLIIRITVVNVTSRSVDENCKQVYDRNNLTSLKFELFASVLRNS